MYYQGSIWQEDSKTTPLGVVDRIKNIEVDWDEPTASSMVFIVSIIVLALVIGCSFVAWTISLWGIRVIILLTIFIAISRCFMPRK
jgi:uncharacterized membrane protein